MSRILIISGSHRQNSQSSKVARWCERSLRKMGEECETLDLAGNPLPLWDESFWENDPKWKASWGPIEAKLKRAEGFVVIAPEWNGMAPAGLKNLFLFASGDLMAHKPALIVAVSAGMGGSYPVVELRSSGYKNTRIVYLPDHVIVRKADEMLNDAEKPANTDDERLRTRLDYSLGTLKAYIPAFKQVRESGVFKLKEFPSGM